MELLLVEQAALAVEGDDLGTEAVRGNLLLEVLSDVGTDRTDVLDGFKSTSSVIDEADSVAVPVDDRLDLAVVRISFKVVDDPVAVVREGQFEGV